MIDEAGEIGGGRRAQARRQILASLRHVALVLCDGFLAERERWALWVPALLGSGIGLYFMLTVEPPASSGPAAVACAVLLALLARRRAALLLPALAGLIAAVGFADAQLQTWFVAVAIKNKLVRHP
jgi:competence protein ComEC